MYSSTADGGVIHEDAALGHYLLEVSQTQVIVQIPPNAERDYCVIKMRTLEYAMLRQ